MKGSLRNWQRVVVIVGIVLGLMVPAPSLAQVVFPPDAVVFGKTYAEWSAVWWQWILSIPIPSNPAFDTTGQHCRVQQSRPVFFLAGAGDFQPVTRECRVPSDTSLFFAIINAECSDVEPPPFFGGTDAERLACAQELIDDVGVNTLSVTIDGVEVEDLSSFRVPSPPFNFRMPAQDNFLSLPGVTRGRSASDGYWLMLEPLSPGPHVIHVKGTLVSGPFAGFSQDVTFHLTVAQEPVVQTAKGRAEQLGTANAKVTLEGQLTGGSFADIDLGASTVTITSILNEAGVELVAGSILPLTLEARPGSDADGATFGTSGRTRPKVRVDLSHRGEETVSFRLVVEFAPSQKPALCEGTPRTTELTMSFQLDPGPVSVTTTQPWECLAGDSQLRVPVP